MYRFCEAFPYVIGASFGSGPARRGLFGSSAVSWFWTRAMSWLGPCDGVRSHGELVVGMLGTGGSASNA